MLMWTDEHGRGTNPTPISGRSGPRPAPPVPNDEKIGPIQGILLGVVFGALCWAVFVWLVLSWR
jgi:hypothetical protein